MWLPTAYAALRGLADYGYFDISRDASRKILDYMLKTYESYEPHTIWECYSPSEYAPGTTADNKGISKPDFCGWSALGPISLYIEYILGFCSIDAFENTVEWRRPRDLGERVGIENLRFGKVVTDIVAEGDVCTVRSNAPYTLTVDGKTYEIKTGENKINL